MTTVTLTDHLSEYSSKTSFHVTGDSVAHCLQEIFQSESRLRGYLLDDQGRPRKHVAIFLNGKPVNDREWLTDPVEPMDGIFVMQALSGG